MKAEKSLNETAIDTRACLYAPRNNFLVLVKRIHKVHRTKKVSGSFKIIIQQYFSLLAMTLKFNGVE